MGPARPEWPCPVPLARRAADEDVPVRRDGHSKPRIARLPPLPSRASMPSRRTSGCAKGPERMARLRALTAVASIASLALAVGSALPASADTSTGASTYSQPTWWQKFQTVSAPGFAPLPSPGTTHGVSVGPNVDVSNEPGPQSETSIAINPSGQSQIVAGSNDIFPLPMPGYFSPAWGSSWGGVDLPLPPPLVTNGTDFGSDPSVAWDTHGNVFYAFILGFFSHGFGHGVAINRTQKAGG